MKKSILCLLLTMVSVPLFSAFLKNVPIEIVQPDGTVLQCYVTGDEFYRRVHDRDDYTIIRHPGTGYYVYAVAEGEDLVPSQFVVGKVNPVTTGLAPGIEIPAKQREFIRNERLKSATMLNENPTKGNFNNIVISIRFYDQARTSLSAGDYQSRFNAASGYSLKNYFREISQSQLNVTSYIFPAPDGQVIVEYEDAHPRDYYRPYDEATNPAGYSDSNWQARDNALMKNAILFAASEIAGSSVDFDANDDGFIDNITFVIQGNTDGWGKILWPTSETLASENIFIGNKKVGTYNKQLSLWFTADVLSHEFFHSLGAPDLYRYVNKSLDPVSYWDIMGMTGYQHPTAYVKWKYGKWIDQVPEINDSGNYSLQPVSRSPFACYKIPSPVTQDEYFMVEYRKKEGIFEGTLPVSFADGLIIYRINTKVADGNAFGPPDEVYVYRMQGTNTYNGILTSSSFSIATGMTEFSNTTYPPCFLSDDRLGGIKITGIGAAGETISFSVNQDNHRPVANAGPDQTVNEGTDVTLDGTSSSDPDGDPLSYHWTAPEGIILSSTRSEKPTFTAPGVGTDSTLVFILVVNDGSLNSPADTVVIIVKNLPSANHPPVSNAGSDQTVNEGTAVTLDGSASSDADGDILHYFWTAPDGIILASATIATPTFTAPGVLNDSTLLFILVVNDGTLNSPADTVVITVKNLPSVNHPPVANAGPDQAVDEGGEVALDGSGSFDPDGDNLTFGWIAPAGILLNSNTIAKPTFTAPGVLNDSTLILKLMVNDGILDSPADSVIINVKNLPSMNHPPVANAGIDQTVNEGTPVTLDATHSTDPDGDSLKYLWITPSPIVINSVTGLMPSFVAPEIARDTIYIIKLVVNDGQFDSDTASVAITVKNVNKIPVANAGPQQTVVEGSVVTLDGSASYDPDGDSLSFYWIPPMGIPLSSVFTAFPTFTAPEVIQDTNFNFLLIVEDEEDLSNPSPVMITVLDELKPGVAEVSREHFMVFPNPTDGIVNIEGKASAFNSEVTVFNVVGDVIYKREFFYDRIHRIDLSTQVSGLYLIRITQNGKQQFGKIILKKD